MNILSNIHDDFLENVTSRVLIMFSFDLAYNLVFDSKWPIFEPDL